MNADVQTTVSGDSIAQSAHVVFLVNFVAPNHIAVCQEISRRVGRFTVLSSVAMESNREWDCHYGDLDVIVQKTRTITRTARHPSGYEDVNYIHIPLDTVGTLRRLKPDVVVSLELGARSLFSSLYRLLSRRCALVTAVYASERSEAGRGWLRRMTRRRLLRHADWVTYNGPSCQRYLRSLGADQTSMSPWDYAADPEKPYRGELKTKDDASRLKLLTVGQISVRKGVIPALRQLDVWATSNAHVCVQWNVLGTGPLESEMRAMVTASNLEVRFHGHCGPDVLREHYCTNDALLFPTLGDEWGLVVDEALHSGLPVIGSVHSQAAETLLREDINGWTYDPECEQSLNGPLDRLASQSSQSRHEMSARARASIADRAPQQSAQQFVDAAVHAIARRRGIAQQCGAASESQVAEHVNTNDVRTEG